MAFVSVASQLSFQRAAIERGVTRSALSHSIKGLEEDLGVRLLNRHTRAVSLTEPGHQLFQRLNPAFNEIASAVDDLNRFRDSPSGSLRLTAPRAVAQTILSPVIARLTAENPGLSIDLSSDDRLVDIVAEGFDAGIRFGKSLQPDMIAARMTSVFSFAVVGMPEYLSVRGIPRAPKDLLEHQCIRYRLPSGVIFPWDFAMGDEHVSVSINGPITLDDQSLMIETALAGGGLALVFANLADDHIKNGRLVRCLSDWECSLGQLYLYYSSRRHVSSALRVLIDSLT
ncbi:DNA-binding transcriptional LysR family regulator [Rhizobium sp. BK313]|uniref:LysR family transcriptional regulator n=1 Tax=Rhizobium sp. BK313 TaxID=2587081 RepID=UPI00183497C7|nr:LysR family transcriptional regulator [Rhizobium sp. BK313]MBB3452513.1 DNA-binding transcriptional LysR family regulator [Rhizobium sp. BK313]